MSAPRIRIDWDHGRYWLNPDPEVFKDSREAFRISPDEVRRYHEGRHAAARQLLRQIARQCAGQRRRQRRVHG